MLFLVQLILLRANLSYILLAVWPVVSGIRRNLSRLDITSERLRPYRLVLFWEIPAKFLASSFLYKRLSSGASGGCSLL